MKNLKIKIGLFIALSLAGLTLGFFFSGYINLLLSGGNMDDISALHPAAIIKSLAANERHAVLTLWIELMIVAGVSALVFMSRRETFESDTSAIAGQIKTPVAIGQGQHGTARWLKKSEWSKAFSVYRLDESERQFAALLFAGARDRLAVTQKPRRCPPKKPGREVKAYEDKHSADTNLPVPTSETPESEAAEKSQ